MKWTHYLRALGLCTLIGLVQSLSHATMLNEENACTWGIANSELPIPAGSIITNVKLTLHNVSKVRTDSQTSIYIHLLDNPDQGILEITDGQPGNYFDGYGSLLRTIMDSELNATPQDITVDLNQVDNPKSWVWSVYSEHPVISLANSTTVEFKTSSLLTLLDYAGTGRSFGFGIDCDGVSIEAISLDLTIQSITEITPPTVLSFSAGNITSAPVLQIIENQTINEMEMLSFEVSATDADNDNLTYSATNLPVGADFTETVFTWTPTQQQSGTYEVTFTVSDGNHSDSQTVTITVFNMNQPPILTAVGNKNASEDQLLTFAVSATDPEGDEIVYSVTSLPNGAAFSNETFIWIPNYDQSGTYSLTISASDGTLIDSETITITVNNINRVPVIEDIGNQTVTIPETLTFSVSCSDPDEDTLNWSSENLPQGAVFENGNFTWTPSEQQAGVYNITFIANDGNGGTDTATIQITVNTAAPEWAQLVYDEFETGWGHYIDGGRDCRLYTSNRRSHQGSNSVNIQDNSGTSSSFHLTNGIDISGYSEIKIEFWYLAHSMDNSNEDFRLDYWDGLQWVALKIWRQSIEFQNDQFYFETVILSKSDYHFSSDMRIRFVCDASSNYDDVYIDEITISAK